MTARRALESARGAHWEDPSGAIDVTSAALNAVAPGLTVTASAGIARSDEALGLDRIAALADRRLYDAKRLGRDRAVSRSNPGASPIDDAGQ